MSKHEDKYAVFGNPIAHSQSPVIHTLFAQQTNQQMSYIKELVALDGFKTAIEAFQAAGGLGCNVTLPFKQEAWAIADTRSALAEEAGVVNTLVFKATGEIFGDNTDGVGLIRDIINNHQFGLKGRDILLMGAGGAAKGVLGALLQEQPKHLVIANRSPERAMTLADAVEGEQLVTGCSYEALSGLEFDCVINATAASIQNDMPILPPNILKANALCYDLMYKNEPTVFEDWATEHGASLVLNGLGMLVEQAAESFFIWRGLRPDTKRVIEQLSA